MTHILYAAKTLIYDLVCLLLLFHMIAVILIYDMIAVTLICEVALALLYKKAVAHIHLCCDSKYTATATVNICFI